MGKVMKQEKAKALENVQNIGLQPSFVVHTDQDIVFAEDVNPVVNEVNQLEPGYTMALFNDQGVSKGQLHTGIIFLFPGNTTNACLAQWGEKILTTASSSYKGFWEEHLDDQDKFVGPDQKALAATAECQKGKGIKILDPSYLMM